MEAHFRKPQDVEWAAVGDEVYVVQARPITVLETEDGFDTPIDDHELTAAGIVEMVPGVLAPLVWEVNRYLLEESFRSAPGILFVGGAGNSNNDIEFDEFVPPMLQLSNLLIAGAVDQAGEATRPANSGTRSPPSSGITYRPVPPPAKSNALIAIQPPRGDHAGWRSIRASSVSATSE